MISVSSIVLTLAYVSQCCYHLPKAVTLSTFVKLMLLAKLHSKLFCAKSHKKTSCLVSLVISVQLTIYCNVKVAICKFYDHVSHITQDRPTLHQSTHPATVMLYE